MRIGAAGLLVLLTATGCGPAVLWHGKSPDRRHEVRVLEDDGQFVTLDGRPGPTFEGVALGTLTFSPDGRHLAYAAHRGAGWSMVVDGRPAGGFTGLGAPLFAPRGARLAFPGQTAEGWRVIVDGRAGPAFEEVREGTLTFSADGRRHAYVGARGGRVHAVIDGKVGPAFDDVSELRFGGSAAQCAYLAQQTSGAIVVVDGRAGPAAPALRALTLAPVGDRLAYVAAEPHGEHAVLDHAPGPPFDRVSGLAFSPDGSRFAYVAEQRPAEWRVIVEGRPGSAYTAVRPSTLAFLVGAREPTFVAEQGQQVFVVHDGAEGPRFIDVLPPTYSADGRRWAYVGVRADGVVPVVDGVAGRGEPWIGEIALSPRGARAAFTAHRGGRVVVVVDGREHPFDLVLDDTLTFDTGGTRWGCIAGDLEEEELFFVLDGARGPTLDFSELSDFARRVAASGAPAPTGDGALRSWVVAELALAARAR